MRLDSKQSTGRRPVWASAGGAARRLIVLCIALATLALAPAADAAVTSVFGGDVSCTIQPDGARFCGSTSPRSTTKTFDGVPIDVNVGLPRPPGHRARRPLPPGDAVPRLRRQQGRALGDAALARPRLRHVQHDRARLRPVLWQRRVPLRRPERLRAGLDPPHGHPLRGARRAVPRPASSSTRASCSPRASARSEAPTAAASRWRWLR